MTQDSFADTVGRPYSPTDLGIADRLGLRLGQPVTYVLDGRADFGVLTNVTADGAATIVDPASDLVAAVLPATEVAYATLVAPTPTRPSTPASRYLYAVAAAVAEARAR